MWKFDGGVKKRNKPNEIIQSPHLKLLVLFVNVSQAFAQQTYIYVLPIPFGLKFLLTAIKNIFRSKLIFTFSK